MKNNYRMNRRRISRTLLFLVLLTGIPAAFSFADVTLTGGISGNYTFIDHTTVQIAGVPTPPANIVQASGLQTIDANSNWNIHLLFENGPNTSTLINGLYAENGAAINLGNNKVTIGGYGPGVSRVQIGVLAQNAGIFLGDDCVIRAEANNWGEALHARITADGRSAGITIGDNAQLYGTAFSLSGATVVSEGAKVSIGDNAYIANDGMMDTSRSHWGVLAYAGGIVDIGENAVIDVFGNWENSHGIRAGGSTATPGSSVTARTGTVYIGNNATVNAPRGEALSAQIAGTTITAGTITLTGERGISAYTGAAITTGRAVITTTGSGVFADGWNGVSTATIGADSVIRVSGAGYGVHAQEAGIVNIGGGTSIFVGGTLGMGAYANGGTVNLGDGVSITTEGGSAFGIRSRNYNSQNGKVNVGNNAVVRTSGANAHALYATESGEISLQNITVSAAGQSAWAIHALSSGKIYGAGVMDVTGGIYALNNNTGGAGSIQLQFNDGSRFTGYTSIYGTGVVNDLTFLGPNSRWTMTDDSVLTRLEMRDGFRHTIPAGRTLTSNDVIISDGAALSVTGGRLVVNDILSGKAGQTTAGRVNLYGSAGSTRLRQLGSGDSSVKLENHFYIDSTTRGVTSLDLYVSSTAYLDSLVNDATVWGFAQLNSTKYLLIDGTAGTMLGSAAVTHPALTAYEVHQQGNQVYLEMNQSWNEHVWYVDQQSAYYFRDGSEAGMIKIVGGDNTDMRVTFFNLDDTLAQLLADYLNQGMTGSSLRFSRNDSSSLWLGGGDYLNLDGYAFFGWDLRDFNLTHGSNVLLHSFEIPEHSTWVLMGLGLGITIPIFRCRKKR